MAQPSLLGKTYMDVEDCNAIEVVLRGDGRGYILNIQTDSLQPEDLFQSFIYTRGGPYWQTIHVRCPSLSGPPSYCIFVHR
jgi:NADH dehydrogenase [ubiquinone] 1 alpha subcomplex assembly factor 1